MAFAITKTWTNEILTAADLNNSFSEIETELNAFPTDGALTANSVGNSQLASNAVALANMQDDSVGEDEIVDGAVTEAKLGTGAVTNTKLGASAVTAAKVSTILGTTTLNDSDANSLSEDSIYRAGSDGFLLVYYGGSSTFLKLESDSANPPTTVIYDTRAGYQSILAPIISGDYLRVTAQSGVSPTIRWYPIGSGSLVKQ